MLESKVTLLVEYLIGRKIENKTLWLKVKKILAEFASEEEGTRWFGIALSAKEDGNQVLPDIDSEKKENMFCQTFMVIKKEKKCSAWF